jgi:glycosyltransferase involved in cell wall biosynthesis
VWGAGVYVSPLASGAGRVTRLLEALALGTPVVASPASLSRLDDVAPGHHVMTAVSDAEITDAVCLLLREAVVGATLARNARALVEQRRTWRTVAERYEHAYQRLARPALERAA